MTFMLQWFEVQRRGCIGQLTSLISIKALSQPRNPAFFSSKSHYMIALHKDMFTERLSNSFWF